MIGQRRSGVQSPSGYEFHRRQSSKVNFKTFIGGCKIQPKCNEYNSQYEDTSSTNVSSILNRNSPKGIFSCCKNFSSLLKQRNTKTLSVTKMNKILNVIVKNSNFPLDGNFLIKEVEYRINPVIAQRSNLHRSNRKQLQNMILQTEEYV